MRRLACALLALAATQAMAQEEQREGLVYRCEVNGTRYYKSKPVEGVNCTPITYRHKDTPQPSPGWVPMSQGDGVISYYRAKDVTRSGQRVTFWAMDDFDVGQSSVSGIGTFRSSIVRMIVDCGERTFSQGQAAYYSERFGKGKVVGSWQPRGTPEHSLAMPGSMGEVMVDAICAVRSPQPKPKGA